MRITKIQSTPNFKSTPQQVQQQPDQTPEFIDKLLDKVKNPRDINDSVNVPRGIFKAYMCLMAGTGIGAIAGMMPKGLKAIKAPLSIVGSALGILSAAYFAKPFLIKQEQGESKQ